MTWDNMFPLYLAVCIFSYIEWHFSPVTSVSFFLFFFPAFLWWCHRPEVQPSPVPSGEFILNSHIVTSSQAVCSHLMQPVINLFSQADTSHFLFSLKRQMCSVGLKFWIILNNIWSKAEVTLNEFHCKSIDIKCPSLMAWDIFKYEQMQFFPLIIYYLFLHQCLP